MVMIHPYAVQRAPKVGRAMRSPKHHWNVRNKPWQMQPVAIAPVIPGETLKNAVLQARVVSDPVKNRLIGWWNEYYLYYVPFRALAISDELTQMVVDPEWNAVTAGITANVANVARYFAGRNSIDYVKHCLDAIVAYDFRQPDDPTVWEIDGLPIATINNENWTNSLLADSEVQDWDVPVVDGPDANTTLDASEVDVAMQQYELLRTNGLIEMTYEDYLKTYGIKGRAVQKPEQDYTPELIRYIRDWSYPSNTPDAQGNVASALSWSMAERVDKDRLFKEPGFLFMFTMQRPKIYLGNQVGAAVSMLDTIRAWLPKVMDNDPYTSLKKFANGQGPMLTGFADTAPALADATPTQAYWVDVRDLFLYGDQMLRNPNAYQASLPAKDGNLSYPSSAEYNKLFVDQTGNLQHTEQDGMISFAIAGSQRDHTAPVVARTVV